MPTNPLPYQCGTPGCNRKFEKPEHLRQHTKDFHSPSRPPPKPETFKCGVEGCNAPSFPQLLLLHQHTAKAHPKSSKNTPSGSSTSIPLPKPETFKCGVEGCKAPSYPQLSLLLSMLPRPIRSPVKIPLLARELSLSRHKSPTSKPVPKQETFKCGVEGCKAPSFPQLLLLHQHAAKAHPKSSKNTPSGLSTSAFSTQGHPIPITTSSTAQNAISSPDYIPAALTPPLEEVLQRVRQLELRQMLIDKSALKVGMHFVELAEDIIRASTNDQRMSVWNHLKERIEWMSKHNNVCSLAYSAKFRAEVRKLLQDFGYNDITKIQKTFSRTTRSSCIYSVRLVGRVCGYLSWEIQRTGIALKRLHMYQPEPNEMLKFSKEVLTWVHLKHPYVLPFFGLDEQFFEGRLTTWKRTDRYGEHAQLADFGLAIVTDATRGTTSTTRAVRRGGWHRSCSTINRVQTYRSQRCLCLCVSVYRDIHREQPFWSIQ
ncbi:hypothetical protein B0H13DRAFT_2299164, partial [Mycena leptocephala]